MLLVPETLAADKFEARRASRRCIASTLAAASRPMRRWSSIDATSGDQAAH